jgi:hypothetical protein
MTATPGARLRLTVSRCQKELPMFKEEHLRSNKAGDVRDLGGDQRRSESSTSCARFGARFGQDKIVIICYPKFFLGKSYVRRKWASPLRRVAHHLRS